MGFDDQFYGNFLKVHNVKREFTDRKDKIEDNGYEVPTYNGRSNSSYRTNGK